MGADAIVGGCSRPSIRDVLVAIGRRARDFRLEANLSQREAARRAGVSIASYRHFERGDTNVTLVTLERIARGLGVEPLDLLNVGDDEHAQIVELTRTMSPKQLARLKAHVARLKGSGNIGFSR